MGFSGRSPRRASGLWAGLLVWAAAAGIAVAQDGGRHPLSSAHVPVDDRAKQLLDQADAAAARKEWKVVARNLQQALEQYADFVHEIAPGLFVGVRTLVTDRMRDLPPPGKEAWRESFDERARRRFEEAMRTCDRADLLALVEGFPISPWGDRAAAVLGALWLEEGNVSEAIAAWERVCASDLPEIARDGILPLASAYWRAGERQRLEALLERLPQVVGDATLRAGGSAVDAQRRIRDWAASLPPGSAPRAAGGRLAWDRWECFGGDATRSLPLSPSLDLPPKMWSVSIPQGSMPHAFQRDFLNGSYSGADEAYTPFHPVVADGIVFAHNDTQVFAYELLCPDHQGRRLWTFPQPARLGPSEVIFEEHAFHTSTLADGRLFVNVVWTRSESERQLDWLDVKLPLPNRALIALEAQTGRLLWRFGGLRANESQAFADLASIACAPAAVGRHLFAGAVYQANATNPIEHWVCRVDAATGELQWRTNVCSGFLEMNLFNNPTRESVGSPVTVVKDTVLYCTNMGVIAALDARSGRVRWLKRYRQYQIGPTRDIHAERMQRAWANNPILVQGGRMFVAPTDSPYLHALDLESGKELWTRVRDFYDARDPVLEHERYLLGLAGPTLFVSGQGVLALDVATGRKRWGWRSDASDAVAGRGGVTADAVYVPTRTRLWRLGLDGAEKASWRWTERDAGNVLIADSVLLTTSPRALTAWFSLEGIEKQLAGELARDPDNPYLRYRVGLGHQKAGRPAEAGKAFEEAVRLGEARGDADARRAAEGARQALYRLHLDLGRKAWDRKDRKTGLAEFAQAKAWARDDASIVEIAFTAAALLHEEQSFAEAVRELQAVIEEHPEVPYARGTAREYAREHIDVILGAAGRAAYAPFEERAQALAAEARRSQAVPDWLAVVARYPNSTAAEGALLSVAQRLYAGGLYEDAIDRLLQLLEYRQSAAHPDAYRLLVLCDEKRGTFTTARNHLLQLLRKFPEAQVTEPEGPVAVKEFVQRRLARPEYQQLAGAGRRRELSAPLGPAWTFTDAGSADLILLQPGGAMPAEAGGLVFVHSRGVIHALRWKTGEQVWRAQVEKVPRASVFFDRSLIVACNSTVYSLAIADGRELWRCALDEYYAQDLRISEGTLFLGTYQRVNKATMRLSARDAQSGRELWSFPYREGEGMLLGEEWVLVPTASTEFAVLDREKGLLSHRIALGGRPLRVLMPGPDRLVVMVARNKLACFDVASGRRLWQQDTGQIMTDFLLSNGNVVTFVERDPGNVSIPLLVVMDPETGKRLVRGPISEGDFPVNAAIDDQNLYVTFRVRAERDRLYVTAFRLQGGATAWTSPRLARGGSPQVQNPILSGGWFLLNGTYMEQPSGRWLPVTAVIQRTDGAQVQELTPEPAGSTAPSMVFENGVLGVIQGSTLSAYVGE